MQGKVEICGVNTAHLQVLNHAEMDALLRKSREGDTSAREKLIEGNLRLVLSVIQRFDRRGENPDDLFQVGCIGLIKAISNFDPDKQVRFSTYGVPMIVLCRNNKGVSAMTRKQALHKAIAVLRESQENQEAAAVLEALCAELPIVHWTDTSIRDAVEQHILEHGAVPRPSAFKKAGLPSHTVMQNTYGIPLKEWLHRNYPSPGPSQDEQRAKCTADFIAEYERIQPRSAEAFNARRSAGVRSWYTIARYNHCRTWRGLLRTLQLTPWAAPEKGRAQKPFQVHVQVDAAFYQE